jgi:hypothetical protein
MKSWSACEWIEYLKYKRHVKNHRLRWSAMSDSIIVHYAMNYCTNTSALLAMVLGCLHGR